MKLVPKASLPTVDLHDRMRAEVQLLPPSVHLRGEPSMIALATALLEMHAPKLRLADDGTPVQVMGMEECGERAIQAFLDGAPLPRGAILLWSIPEAVLRVEAERRGITLPERPRTKAREILDLMTKDQPQTPFSLARSVQRLRALIPGAPEDSSGRAS